MSVVARKQIEQEINGALDFVKYIYGHFGFTFSMKLSTRPENYMGDINLWNAAEAVCACVYVCYVCVCYVRSC